MTWHSTKLFYGGIVLRLFSLLRPRSLGRPAQVEREGQRQGGGHGEHEPQEINLGDRTWGRGVTSAREGVREN